MIMPSKILIRHSPLKYKVLNGLTKLDLSSTLFDFTQIMEKHTQGNLGYWGFLCGCRGIRLRRTPLQPRQVLMIGVDAGIDCEAVYPCIYTSS